MFFAIHLSLHSVWVISIPGIFQHFFFSFMEKNQTEYTFRKFFGDTTALGPSFAYTRDEDLHRSRCRSINLLVKPFHQALPELVLYSKGDWIHSIPQKILVWGMLEVCFHMLLMMNLRSVRGTEAPVLRGQELYTSFFPLNFAKTQSTEKLLASFR